MDRCTNAWMKRPDKCTHCSRPASSGTPSAISWSKRPARRSAGSSESGRLVAPIIITGLPSVFSHERSTFQDYMSVLRLAPGMRAAAPLYSPSRHVNNCATIRLSISRCAVSRFGVMASISSMKRIAGAIRAASSKVSRNVFSLSPEVPETIDGAETDRKGTESSCIAPSRQNHYEHN